MDNTKYSSGIRDILPEKSRLQNDISPNAPIADK